MARWEPDGVGRLQEAAFELFAEQGFERTTVAEITERAGLTKRSFFNHFTDKREVLFGPVSEQQREAAVRGVADCPEGTSPLDAAVGGLRAVADEVFEGRRDAVLRRGRIIDATPELQERELRKRAALTEAVARALRARGVDEETALVAAHTASVVQHTAMRRWTESSSTAPLRDHLAEALRDLRAITAGP